MIFIDPLRAQLLQNNMLEHSFQALEAGHGEWDESVQYPVFDQSEIRIGDALDASERYAERNSTADGWPNNQARRSEPYRDPVPRPPLVVSVADLPPVVVGRPGAVPPSASLEVAPGTPPLASLEARALEYDLTSSESSGQQENDLFDTTPDLSESESLSPIIVRRQNFDLASSQSSSSPSTEEEVVNSHNDYLEAQRPGRQ